MCLICMFKMASTRTVQKGEISHISATSHIKTNNGSTPKFSGTGNPLVSLLLWFNVTPRVNVKDRGRHQKVKICHISVTAHHNNNKNWLYTKAKRFHKKECFFQKLWHRSTYLQVLFVYSKWIKLKCAISQQHHKLSWREGWLDGHFRLCYTRLYIHPNMNIHQNMHKL